MNQPKENQELLPCPCCGSLVLASLGSYEICSVCGWEDDPIQSTEPEYAGGANKLSLTQARNGWIARTQST
jgi:hypothetical protein